MAEPRLEPITAGDDRQLKATATWPEDVPEAGAAEGDPYPLDGKLLYFTAKLDRAEPDSTAIFQKNSTDQSSDFELAVSPGGGGVQNVVLIDINREDTEDLEEPVSLKCDLQVTDEAGGTVWTVWIGTLPVQLGSTQTSGIGG